MASREKITPSPTSVEPKKSVRLAQKRKLREESGTGNEEDEFYFTPYQFSKSNSPRSKAQNSRSNSPSTFSPSPTKRMRGRGTPTPESNPETFSNNVTPPASKVYAPSPKARTISPITASASRVTVSEDSNSSVSTSSSSIPIVKKKVPKISSAKEEVLEEEKWLDALESGKLEELDEELRQMKNPRTMTARQRALMEKKDKDVYGFSFEDELGQEKDKVVITQEMIKLKAEKTEKRRQLAQEKKESDKKKTMDRLLKKQKSKIIKGSTRPKGPKKVTDLKFTYISKLDKSIIAFPAGFPLPFQNKKQLSVPPAVSCGVEGCTNPKKYSCSKTGLPLCSLACYKKSLCKEPELIS